MLNIDCLLRNTAVKDALRSHIEARGLELAAEGKNASFEAIYNEMKEAGVEVDKESAALMYEETLTKRNLAQFSTSDELHYSTGNWWKNIVHTLSKRAPKTGEKVIGELSAADAAVKTISDIFNSNVVEDHTTKSILKTIQDEFIGLLRPMLGELPNDKSKGPDTRTLPEMLKEVLDRQKLGTRRLDGKMNTIHDVLRQVQDRIGEIAGKMEGSDPLHVDQWKGYVQDIMDAVTMGVYKSGEGKRILTRALMEADPEFVTKTSSGELVPNYEAMAGKMDSIQTLRDNVRKALENQPDIMPEEVDSLVNGMHNDFSDMRAEMLRKSKEAQDRRDATTSKTKPLPQPIKIEDMVNQRIEATKNYAGLIQDAQKDGVDVSGHVAKLNFTNKEMRTILTDALVKTGLTRKNRNGKDMVSIDKVIEKANSVPDIREIVRDYLKNNGYSKEAQDGVPDVMQHAYDKLFDQMRDRVHTKEQFIDDSWNQAAAAPKKALFDRITERLKDYGNFQTISGNTSKSFRLRKSDAEALLADTLRNSDTYSKEVSNSNRHTQGHPTFGQDKVSAIDWKKLVTQRPDHAELQKMVYDHMVAEGYSQSDVHKVIRSLDATFDKLHDDIDAYSQAQLVAAQDAVGREVQKPVGAQLKRLAQLNDMGIFNGSYENLLSNITGISPIKQEAINDMKPIVDNISNILRSFNGDVSVARTPLAAQQKALAEVFRKYRGDRTLLYKMSQGFNDWMQLQNMAMVSGWKNLLENQLSGIQRNLSNTMDELKAGGKGFAMNPQMLSEMANVWGDVSTGGEHGHMRASETSHMSGHITDAWTFDKLKQDRTKNPVKKAARALATVTWTGPRAMLTGTDMAFKIANYQMHFNGMMRKVLETTGMSGEDANDFLHETLFGKNSVSNSIARAENYYNGWGIPASKASIQQLARSLREMELQTRKEITPEIISEISKSAYHTAGMDMGHEANTFSSIFSFGAESASRYYKSKIADAEAKGEYNKAAMLTAMDTVVNKIGFAFMGAQARWLWIKLEQGGMGLITGAYSLRMAKSKAQDIEMKWAKSNEPPTAAEIVEQAKYYNEGRKRISNALVGMAVNAAVANLLLPMWAQMQAPDDEDDKLGWWFDQHLKDSPISKALFFKLAPIWAWGRYAGHSHKDMDSERGAHKAAYMALQFLPSQGDIGDAKTAPVQMAEMSRQLASQNEERQEKAMGQLGKMLTNRFNVPLWRQGADVVKLINYKAGNAPFKYHYPVGFMNGAMGGGMVEDIHDLMGADWETFRNRQTKEYYPEGMKEPEETQ